MFTLVVALFYIVLKYMVILLMFVALHRSLCRKHFVHEHDCDRNKTLFITDTTWRIVFHSKAKNFIILLGVTFWSDFSFCSVLISLEN